MPRKPKAAAVEAATTAPLPQGDGVSVTYVPRDGDPVRVKWDGIEFTANVPVLVTKPHIIEAARGNPWFHVGEDAPAPKPAEPQEPQTAEEYRGYVVAWLKGATTSDLMQRRWDAEAPMREDLGVGTDDLEWIGKFFNPQFEQLKKAEAG